MYKTVYVFGIISLLIVSCAKEYSYEGEIISYNAKGTLQDSLNQCRDIQIVGNYIKDSALDQTNYIIVWATITAAGKYLMYTDTVNGYYFRDTGTVANIGLQSFVLKGFGKPASTRTTPFTVHFDASICSFIIPINKAIYTFNAPSNNCPVIIVNGIYYAGATLNSSDSAMVPVTVFQPGTYSIQTPLVNGMQFSASGVFPSSGNYIVSLMGNGKPQSKGISHMPLIVNNITCSFPVTVNLDTSMYWTCTVEGITYLGLMDSGYKVLPDTGVYYGSKKVFVFQGVGGDLEHSFANYGLLIQLSQLNYPLTTGIYYPNDALNISGLISYVQLGTNTIPNTNSYANSYVSSQRLSNFQVHLISFDRVSKLIEGTFSGSVYKSNHLPPDPSSPIFQMINGHFKTYMAH